MIELVSGAGGGYITPAEGNIAAGCPPRALGRRLRALQTYTSAMDADVTLMRAWGLGMDGAGWSDSVMDEAERLLPELLSAGYAATDVDADTWWFTPKGVARAEQLETTPGRVQ
jgi:hypothetical protein